MTVHVAELTSQVELTGVPPVAQAPAGAPARTPGWHEAQRFAELAEERHRDRARTAGGGFDD
ncbi:hypothetical protein FXF51_20300 [Nonomuraea sp. PA05]|uniref:hypothetical protein n=1 Tax=Nonomuraea sp. PA05 TaxID=2604466 RepID=UPI0011D6796A|nr:hypothetical protein [Nonomuraea sp. PA05]TYB64797.1 hypothetical protein FXF51_20300 [Nonomuraea sp. PA05]